MFFTHPTIIAGSEFLSTSNLSLRKAASQKSGFPKLSSRKLNSSDVKKLAFTNVGLLFFVIPITDLLLSTAAIKKPFGFKTLLISENVLSKSTLNSRDVIAIILSI